MKIELSESDIVFIYGCFQKELSQISKIESSLSCPFDKETIKNQKEPYLNVVEKLCSQVPGLKNMNQYF